MQRYCLSNHIFTNPDLHNFLLHMQTLLHLSIHSSEENYYRKRLTDNKTFFIKYVTVIDHHG